MGKKTILLLCMIILAGCTRQDEPITDISEQQCRDAGGNWNECSSPCLGEESDACIQVCVAQCECGGIAGFNCPEGYECKISDNYPDAMGRCVKE